MEIEVYKDHILQLENKDYKIVDNVIIFTNSLERQRPGEYIERDGLFYPLSYTETNCGRFTFLGQPIKELPENAILIVDSPGTN